MSEVNNDMIRAVLQILRAVKQETPAPQSAAPTTPEAQAAQQQPVPTLFEKLAQGQQYPVTVLNPNLEGKALLRLLGEKVVVETTMQLKQGQRLQVEVVSKNDVIQLQVKQSPTQAEIKAQYLKLVLPKQEPISQLLKNLDNYLQSLPAAKQETVPQSQLQLLARQFLGNIPSLADLKDPLRFQKVLSESGIFLESRLGHGKLPSADLKSNLLKIAELLRPVIIDAQQKTVAISAYNAVKTPLAATRTDTATVLNPNPTAVNNPSTARQHTAANVAPQEKPGADMAGPAAAVKAETTPQTSRQQVVNPISSVTEKTTLTATQAAQKASMLGRSEPLKLVNSITPNLLSSMAIQNLLSLIPKTELQILIKQMLFKNSGISERSAAVAGTGQRLLQIAELLRSVESSIARIQTQQLASVSQDDTTRQIWQLEIPFRDSKEMQALLMRIEQDDSNADDETGSTWTVSLNFNIGSTGHIHSKIRLTTEVISTHFWSEEAKTAEKISAYLPRLGKALEKIGLTVNHMTSAVGKPPDPVEITRIEESLLDEKA